MPTRNKRGRENYRPQKQIARVQRHGIIGGFDFSGQMSLHYAEPCRPYKFYLSLDGVQECHVPKWMAWRTYRNYRRFRCNVKPGDRVFVIIWDEKRRCLRIKSDIIAEIYFHNYTNPNTLWGVWLEHSTAGHGLQDTEHYFTTRQQAEYTLKKIQFDYQKWRI